MTRYAQAKVLQLLKNLERGRLNILIDLEFDNKPHLLSFGEEGHNLEYEAIITVKRSTFWTRVFWHMDRGFAEAFMLGEADCDDLVKLFIIIIRNREELKSTPLAMKLLQYAFQPLKEALLRKTNTVPTALENVVAHYDISNDHFASFLSPDMSYSCPIWTPTHLIDHEESLEVAQLRKIDNIIKLTQIQPNDHCLDIGGGWGSLAIEAVKRTGCRFTVTTLSVKQKEWGEARILREGLKDKINYVLCDYRRTPSPPGGYDKVISIEMLEHVGRKYMKDFFASIHHLVKPVGGRVFIQAITITEEQHNQISNKGNFVGRYIFPGTYLASTYMLLDSLHKGSRGKLEVETVQSIGPNYAKALRLWREKFLSSWADGNPLNRNIGTHLNQAELFAFKQKWIYWFSYMEALFREDICGTHVIVSTRNPNTNLFEGVPL
ncbi:cyclopropane-fatty-acyl-phospholipid synthase [Glonium stellatum]|uniref:Cyclopropane-fatty-acyl-phospholipid synthase n=1 Tax=Glonium stellatum TaxID=574774 RepID=A0A8E2JZA5_9PEZI|nr:cyclopropane-fatty-acyl-phospholipid synthase [Glonium stellatum]